MEVHIIIRAVGASETHEILWLQARRTRGETSRDDA
jgi:hypothetical protein